MDYGVDTVVSLISRIHSLSQDFLRRRMTDAGLPELVSSHGFMLFCLSRTERMTLGELAQRINRDKSTTTVLVRKLEATDLVATERDESDSRKKYIRLTEKGTAYNAVTARLSDELLRTSYRDFSAAEQDELLRLLLKLHGNIADAQAE
ncbi:MAG: MarR family transcriptional regulator [Treponemataceae bacterium]|nr:MarR family transcriptional regulator [Treponemataceae bacterium]